MDNFAVALLGFYWVDQLVAEASDAGERHKQIRETFLRYEQLTGYVRCFGDAPDIMGITRIKARIRDDSCKISLGLSSDQQILSDQASYGLWGLYSSAARDTGLVEGNDRKITVNGQSIVQLIIAQLDVDDAADKLLKMLCSGDSLDRDQIKSVSEVFMNAVRHRSVREPLLHALMSGNDPSSVSVQSELWKITQGLSQSDRPSPEDIDGFVQKVLSKSPSADLRQHLNDIIETERLLVATNNIFNYCRRKDGGSLSEILSTLDARYVYAHLPAALPGGNFPRRQALANILSAFQQKDTSRLIKEIFSLNKEVMMDRSGAPWVEVEGGKTLRVKVKSEKAELAGQQEIEQRWDYEYFLGSFLRIARNHFGTA